MLFVKQTLYHLKRDYPHPLSIYRVTSNEINLDTGIKSKTFRKIFINQAILLPSILSRKYLTSKGSDSSYGGYYDVATRLIVVDLEDVPDDFQITVDDYVVTDQKRYEIKNVETLEHNQGILLTVKETVGLIACEILENNASSSMRFNQSLSGVL